MLFSYTEKLSLELWNLGLVISTFKSNLKRVLFDEKLLVEKVIKLIRFPPGSKVNILDLEYLEKELKTINVCLIFQTGYPH